MSIVEITWTHPQTDEELLVECIVSGRYVPATRLDPPDFPTVELLGVVEDREGGVARPELLEDIAANGDWLQVVEERALDAAEDQHAGRLEDAAEAREGWA